MRLKPGHIFMQDRALGHAKKETLADLIERGIRKLSWPPFSLDLNPIETVWNWTKE
jgi:transposase